MSAAWTILGMGVGVYALRLAGLALPDRAVPPAWGQALRFLPVALLAALVVSGLTVPAEDGSARLVAAAGAALVAWRTGRMWACILCGMVIYWLMRLA